MDCFCFCDTGLKVVAPSFFINFCAAPYYIMAATVVFNTPYLVRYIMRLAGQSARTARLVTPAVHRLEIADPNFKIETDRLLPCIRLSNVLINVKYGSVREECLWLFEQLEDLTVYISVDGKYTEYSRLSTIRGTLAQGWHSVKAPFIAQNQPYDPELWHRLIAERNLNT